MKDVFQWYAKTPAMMAWRSVDGIAERNEEQQWALSNRSVIRR
jgi:hypothetical protein